jgi:hypothetical protein
LIIANDRLRTIANNDSIGISEDLIVTNLNGGGAPNGNAKASFNKAIVVNASTRIFG